MIESTGNESSESPPSATEELLCAFLDTAVDDLLHGRSPRFDSEVTQSPELYARAEHLVKGVQQLCEVGATLWENSGVLGESIQLEMGQPAQPIVDPFPGEFRLVRRLGSGAFAEVWLASDLNLGRQVALKRLRLVNGTRSSMTALDTLQTEGRLLVQVDHPNIVRVLAWRHSAPDHYLVLQYVDGGSLDDCLKREGPLAWDEAARYVADIAEGLLAIHRVGIVHRDIKPANILLDASRDEALLTDFGLSARLDGLTNIAGSRPYMAPEAFNGSVSPALDVYALAATLFQLITGELPFPAQSTAELFDQITQGLPTPDPRCECMPEPIEQLIRRCLRVDPLERPALSEFTTTLRGSLNSLLADSLMLPLEAQPGPISVADLRIVVSRLVEGSVFFPIAATPSKAGGFLRDLKRVPRNPAQVGLRTGDRVKIEVLADRPGYVTVFNVGPTGNLNLLFPSDSAVSKLPPMLEANRPLQILDVELALPAGRERLFAIWSYAPLPLRSDELLTLAERGEIPVSSEYRATRDMVRVQYATQGLGLEDYRVAVLELDHRPG